MTDNIISVEDVNFSKNDFINRNTINQELQKTLMSTDVLFLPKINFRENLPVCFIEDTGEIYRLLKNKLKDQNISVDISASDEEYKEIELHDWWIYLPDLYIQNQIFLPLIMDILSAWVYDKFIKGSTIEKSPKIKFNAIIDKKRGYKKLTYEGNYEGFKKLMDNVQL